MFKFKVELFNKEDEPITDKEKGYVKVSSGQFSDAEKKIRKNYTGKRMFKRSEEKYRDDEGKIQYFNSIVFTANVLELERCELGKII